MYVYVYVYVYVYAYVYVYIPSEAACEALWGAPCRVRVVWKLLVGEVVVCSQSGLHGAVVCARNTFFGSTEAKA